MAILFAPGGVRKIMDAKAAFLKREATLKREARAASPEGQAESRQGKRIRSIRSKRRSATVLTGSGGGAGLGVIKRKNATSQTGAPLG